MPVYKAYILNKEINVNYEKNEKEKLLESIDAINSKLETYDNLKGKISDSKLLSFLAIKLQAELIHLNEKKQKDLKIDNKSKARTGVISTPHGNIETPAFIFCGTKAALKSINVESAKKCGTQIILSNTLIFNSLNNL